MAQGLCSGPHGKQPLPLPTPQIPTFAAPDLIHVDLEFGQLDTYHTHTFPIRDRTGRDRHDARPCKTGNFKLVRPRAELYYETSRYENGIVISLSFKLLPRGSEIVFFVHRPEGRGVAVRF